MEKTKPTYNGYVTWLLKQWEWELVDKSIDARGKRTLEMAAKLVRIAAADWNSTTMSDAKAFCMERCANQEHIWHRIVAEWVELGMPVLDPPDVEALALREMGLHQRRLEEIAAFRDDD